MNRGFVFDDLDLSDSWSSPQSRQIPTPLKKQKILILAGPTAVGKTELSLTIAQAIGGEIISADSMQVYRGMDIGTAKASPEDRRRIVHHLINGRDLDERFNAMDFYCEATQAIREIVSRDHVPIVVGGTGFYINTLLYGPPGGPPSEPAVRKRIEEEWAEKGPQILYAELTALDPAYAATITPNDRQKIIRAFEIMRLTQRKVSDFAHRKRDEEYDLRCWFIYMPREILYPRIDARCEQMLAQGFVDEVKALEKEGLRQNSSASQAIGYRQCLRYFDSPQTPQDWEYFVTSFKQASRQYAKRQFTWFRREPLFRWLDIHAIPKETAVELILQDFELNL